MRQRPTAKGDNVHGQGRQLCGLRHVQVTETSQHEALCCGTMPQVEERTMEQGKELDVEVLPVALLSLCVSVHKMVCLPLMVMHSM